MALDEGTRHALHLRFDEMVGPDLAAAMMTAYSPPVAWEDVATKQDLQELELKIEAMLHREINAAITSQTRTIVFAMIGTMLSTAAVVLAGVGLG